MTMQERFLEGRTAFREFTDTAQFAQSWRG